MNQRLSASHFQPGRRRVAAAHPVGGNSDRLKHADIEIAQRSVVVFLKCQTLAMLDAAAGSKSGGDATMAATSRRLKPSPVAHPHPHTPPGHGTSPCCLRSDTLQRAPCNFIVGYRADFPQALRSRNPNFSLSNSHRVPFWT